MSPRDAAPGPLVAVGADAGHAPEVKVFNSFGGQLVFDFMAYDTSFLGGVRVAVGDVDGDSFDDIVTAAGTGGAPHVKVFSGRFGQLQLLAEFYAYSPGFSGGVFVAAGDVNGDGKADIITGAGPGGGPHVKVIDGTKLGQVQTNGQIADTALLQSFYAYSPTFSGGVRVAAGDVNGDREADVITGAGAGGGPHVRVFSQGNPNVIFTEFMAFNTSYTGGIFVAGGDLNGDANADLVVSQGQGTAAQVSAFSGADGHLFGTITPFAESQVNGARVAAVDSDADGRQDVIVGPGPLGVTRVVSFSGITLTPLGQSYLYDPSFLGGVFVG